MKTKLGIAIGSAFGVIIYEVLKHGVQQIDWTRVAAVPAITFLLLLFVPIRFFTRKRTANS